jgi:hypothetical protein
VAFRDRRTLRLLKALRWVFLSTKAPTDSCFTYAWGLAFSTKTAHIFNKRPVAPHDSQGRSVTFDLLYDPTRQRYAAAMNEE